MQLLTTDVDGPIHYADHGGPQGADTVVLVHGLGASHLSWLLLAEQLIDTHRVIAMDLVGFGHTAPEGRGVAVEDNRHHLARFLRQVTDGPVTLVGNSMGGMVSALTAHAHPTLVDALVLINPALPSTFDVRRLRNLDPRLALYFALYNTPVLGEAFLRLRRQRVSPQRQVEQLLQGVCADPSAVEQRMVDMLVSSVTARRGYDWADSAFLSAERSIMIQLTVGRRRYVDVLAGLSQPTLLVHGEQDRLIDVASARWIAPQNPRMTLVTMPGTGHVPQLEAPQELAGTITRWLAGAHDRAA